MTSVVISDPLDCEDGEKGKNYMYKLTLGNPRIHVLGRGGGGGSVGVVVHP